MGIYDELQQMTAAKFCKMERLLQDASEQDRLDIEKALANPDISTNSLYAVMRKHNYIIGYTAMQKHRRGECSCVNI